MLRRPRGYRRERRAGSRGKGGGGGGSNDDVSGEEEEEASPNEMLVAATEALSSLQFSIEHKRKAQEDDWEDAMARDLEDTALSLLEILRRTLLYAAHRANNSGALLAHQFSALTILPSEGSYPRRPNLSRRPISRPSGSRPTPLTGSSPRFSPTTRHYQTRSGFVMVQFKDDWDANGVTHEKAVLMAHVMKVPLGGK